MSTQAPPPLLELVGIEKGFSDVPVLKRVGLTLAAGRVLGLVGENGAGKSTLLNVLGGVFSPERGELRLAGAAYAPRSPAEAFARGVAFVHQELNLFPNLSVAENVFLHALPRRGPLVDRGRLAERTRALLSEVGLERDPGDLVEALSPGERQLVEIAKALAFDARVVILDEPTTSLGARERERLFGLVGRLRARGCGVVYVSHALADVLRLADDVVVLRDGAVVGEGAASGFDEARLVALMAGRELEAVFEERSRAFGEVVVEARGIRSGRVRGVDLVLRRGEVVGLAGLMGAGRSALLRALFGLDRREAGELRVAGRPVAPAPRAAIASGIALVTEDRRLDGLVLDASVADNLVLVALRSLARAGVLTAPAADVAARQQASGVRLDPPGGLDMKARSLSGGNQQKLVLGKWLLAKPSVFLLDEPTRGIDVAAKQQVYRLVAELARGGAAVLVASSELEELVGLCDRILVLRRGAVEARFVRPGLAAGPGERESFDVEELLRAAIGAAPPGEAAGRGVGP